MARRQRSASVQAIRANAPERVPWWPAASRMHARYLLAGCYGVRPAPREHVFKVIDYGVRPPTSLGYMTVDDAVARFGPTNLFMSMSHGICPACETRALADSPGSASRAGRRNKADEPARLGLVWYLGRPRTLVALEVEFRLHLTLREDLRVLTRAGYLKVRGAGDRVSYSATVRGRRACVAWNRSLISPARRAFRGKKER